MTTFTLRGKMTNFQSANSSEFSMDTTLGHDLNHYLRIVQEEGFQKLLELDFLGKSSQAPEKLVVFYHYEYGILLKFDTYGSAIINSGHLYYNTRRIESNDRDITRLGLFSSGFRVNSNGESIWVGSCDCREELRRKLLLLNIHGIFVREWVKQPFLSLVHHGDNYRGYRANSHRVHAAITAERIAMLPMEVQEAIRGQS